MSVEVQLVSQSNAPLLGEFLEILAGDTEAAGFHPHPLTVEHAHHLAMNAGKDLYYVVVVTNPPAVLAYGMLRGWNEGFDVPSLGIAVHPSFRSHGLGTTLIHFLHMAARIAGATRIRLTVEDQNVAAARLYAELGYQFSASRNGVRIGTLELQ